jgi:hypothetical protein
VDQVHVLRHKVGTICRSSRGSRKREAEGGEETMTRAAVLVLMLCLTASACGGSEPTAPSPAPSNGYAGRWSGTVLVLPLIPPGSGIPTIQSQPLSFAVSADQRVTDISIGYSFNGCSGVKTFSGLSIAIASPLGSQGQGWGYASPTSDGRDHVEVYGAFTSDRTASGTSLFVEFPGCNSGGGNWTATKQ